MTLTEIISRFDAKRNGKEWVAHCPCHEDSTASLSINEGDNGNILMTCRAGCKTDTVLSAKGLKLSDLFADDKKTSTPPPQKRLIKTYDYVDANGDLLYQKCRYQPKTFAQRRPDPDKPKEWLWSMNGQERVLYCLPKIIEAIKDDIPIFICEGEKAVQSAESLGFTATCSPDGAGKWKDTYTQSLKDAICFILPDNDEPGRESAKLIEKSLRGTAASVRIIELPKLPIKGDLCDFIESRDAQDTESIRNEIIALTEEIDITILPSIINAVTFTSTPIPEPPQVIAGVLHRGSKAVYGGPSKAFKTWTLLDLCLAVSTGTDWLGFDTTPGPVLYMNFELQPFAVHKRLLILAETRGCEVPHNLHVWNLRGYSRPLSQLLPELMRQIKGEGYSLIIPDPIYKTLSGKNENDAGDIGTVCGEIESVAVSTGAAVAFGAHFAKGNASGKEHIDRVSGSGVWARDPDSIITATTHENDGCFSVEMTLRNFPPPKPFVIRWDFPQMRRDDSLDPGELRQPKGGRPTEYSLEALVEQLSEPMTPMAWLKACQDEMDISKATFFRRVKEAHSSRLIERDGKNWKRHFTK